MMVKKILIAILNLNELSNDDSFSVWYVLLWPGFEEFIPLKVLYKKKSRP